MTAPRRRRRIVLPLVGTTLLATLGGGGWAAYQYGWMSGKASQEPSLEQLESGFADAGKSDLATDLAAAWTDSAAAETAPSEMSSGLPPAGANPYASSPNSPADSLAPPMPSEIDSLPELPTLEVAQDAAVAVPPVADAVVHPTGVSDDPLAASLAALEPSLEPNTVMRGQSPERGAAVPADNPLRHSPGAADSNDARDAFAEPAAALAAQTVAYDAPPEPMPNTAVANPLRPEVPVEPLDATGVGGGLPDLGAVSSDPLAAQFAELPAVPEQSTLSAAAIDRPAPAALEGQQPPSGLGPIEASPLPLPEQTELAPPASSMPVDNSLAPPPAGQVELTPSPSFAAPAAEVASRTPTLAIPEEFADPEIGNPLRGVAAAEDAPFASTTGQGRPGERALEGPQRPALVIQKFAPDEIQVGKECKFVVKVRNMGQRPAEDVVVSDHVPHGTTLVSTVPQADTQQGMLAWQLGTLSPGEERTLEVMLLPTEEGEIGSVAKVTFAAQASAKTKCTRPQLAVRMTAPAKVLVGRQQRVTIELHNPGTGDATGVMLLENVPENVRHEAGPALEFEVGTLRAGETRRMELVLTAERAGAVRNVLTARADGNLQVQQHVDFEVIAPALTVDLEGPTRRYLERPATYTVKIDNPGSAPARDVQLVTQLPRGMKFVRANNLGEYDRNTHSVYWSLAELPPGQTGAVELVTMPMEPGEHTLEVKSRAREGLEDHTTQQVSVEGLPAIMFEVVDLQDPIEVGGNTAYEVRVVNQGTKAATNVAVRVVTPPGMKVVSATGETRYQIDAQGVVFEPVTRLAPKADTLFRLQLQGVQAGDQRILVEVDTDDLTQPVRKEESTRVFGDE